MTTSRHFQIGEVCTTLTTSARSLLAQYSSLYGHWEIDKPGANPIEIDVQRQKFSPLRRRRYDVVANSTRRYEPTRNDEVFPYVEWAINFEVPKIMPQYLQLHASSMEVDGVGVILPGQSGSGKSTLTAGLMSRGWRYLCDEFALIHADTLMLHPFPRAICIKRPSYPVIESLGLSLHGNRNYIKGSKGYVGYLDPLQLGERAIGRRCPVRLVVFPKFEQGARPKLTPISRGEAAFALHEVCFNLFGCSALGIDVLAEMIRGATCYRLVSGEIQATCDLMDSLVGEHAISAAQSA